jgi:hypothetical protein
VIRSMNHGLLTKTANCCLVWESCVHIRIIDLIIFSPCSLDHISLLGNVSTSAGAGQGQEQEPEQEHLVNLLWAMSSSRSDLVRYIWIHFFDKCSFLSFLGSAHSWNTFVPWKSHSHCNFESRGRVRSLRSQGSAATTVVISHIYTSDDWKLNCLSDLLTSPIQGQLRKVLLPRSHTLSNQWYVPYHQRRSEAKAMYTG